MQEKILIPFFNLDLKDYAVSITIVYKNDRGVIQLRLNLRRSGAVTSFVSALMFRCISRMFLFFG
jgi:hypothetical protein